MPMMEDDKFLYLYNDDIDRSFPEVPQLSIEEESLKHCQNVKPIALPMSPPLRTKLLLFFSLRDIRVSFLLVFA